jgi:hypothetical protein
MPKTMKKKPAATKKPAKKRAPKSAKAKAQKLPSNVISFTELFELKKKRLAEAQKQQQQSWKNGTNGVAQHDSPGEKVAVNARVGRTNGMGSRHH